MASRMLASAGAALLLGLRERIGLPAVREAGKSCPQIMSNRYDELLVLGLTLLPPGHHSLPRNRPWKLYWSVETAENACRDGRRTNLYDTKNESLYRVAYLGTIRNENMSLWGAISYRLGTRSDKMFNLPRSSLLRPS